MKRLLFLLLLASCFLTANAQVKQIYPQYGSIWKKLQADSAIKLPMVAVGVKDYYGGFDTAQIYYNKIDSSIKLWTGSQWVTIGAGGSSIDTTSLSNRINLKADKATTLTINGTTYDLSANRSWSVGTITQSQLDDTAAAIRGAIPGSQTLQTVSDNGNITTNKLIFGADNGDTVHQVIINYPNKRNLIIGPRLIQGGNSYLGDSAFYVSMNSRDTISTSNIAKKFNPRAGLGLVRRTDFTNGSTHINFEELGALHTIRQLDFSGSDTATSQSSTSDYSWGVNNMVNIINTAASHRSVIGSGAESGGSVWDATAVNVNTMLLSSGGTSSLRLRGWWAGTTSYIIGNNARDTVDNWASFYATDFTYLGPHIKKYYGYASNFYNNGFSPPHIDSVWFLYERDAAQVGAPINSYSYINGKLSIGGNVTGPTERLQVQGNALVTDTSKLNGRIIAPNLPAGNGTKSVRWDPTAGLVLADTTTATTSLPLSSITAATGANTINSGNNQQEWQWNSLVSGTALKLSSTLTNITAGQQQTMLDITASGAQTNNITTTVGINVLANRTGTNATNTGVYSRALLGSNINTAIYGLAAGSGTAYGGQFSATGTGANTAITASASGGTSNYAIVVPSTGGTVGIGTTTPHASALLQLTSTTRGFMLPDMTAAQRAAISSPLNGLLVYDLDSNRLMQRVSGAWKGLRYTDEGGGASQRFGIEDNSGSDRSWGTDGGSFRWVGLPVRDSSQAYPLGLTKTGDTLVVLSSWPVGGGGGSGTVSSGVANHLAYYPSTGTTVDDVSGITYDGNDLNVSTNNSTTTLNGITINNSYSGSAITGVKFQLNSATVGTFFASNFDNTPYGLANGITFRNDNGTDMGFSTGSLGSMSGSNLFISRSEHVAVRKALYVGDITTTPTTTLQTTSFASGYVAKSVDYTATINDNVIEVTATGKTITLPTAVGITGRFYTIKLTASGSGTVATTSSQTIDGSTTYSLASQYKYVTVQSNGSNWIVTANN
jgi:hypothetical protein